MATDSAKKIYISYGLLEGPLISKYFREVALKHGYSVVKNFEETDVIIGHSAGCYNIPKSKNIKLILLVGPPTLTHNTYTLASQITKKLKYELKQNGLKHTAKKNLKNLYYIFGVKKMILLRRKTLERKIPINNTVLVRNKHDVFNNYQTYIDSISSHTVLSLPGDHDDIWINPETYLQLLNQLERQSHVVKTSK